MRELEVVKYIKTHGFDKTIKDFNLKTNYGDKKVLLKYDMLDSPKSCKEVKECRGLILELDTWKIMAMPFTRFFNHGEGTADKIDWGSAKILTKIDGSLTFCYFDWNSNKWCVATSGTVEATGDVNTIPGLVFNDLFWKTIRSNSNVFSNGDLSFLDRKITYIFELTTPYNIVVTPHSVSSVTLLGARNIETLDELTYEELGEISIKLDIPLVEAHSIKNGVNGINKTFENMPFSNEGYVVVDKYFKRIKIKNPAYVAAHYLKGKTGSYHIIDIIRSNEIDEFVVTFAERKDEIMELKAKYDILLDNLNNAWDIIKTRLPKNISVEEKKKFAFSVFEICEKFDCKNFSGLFFLLKDDKTDSIMDYVINFDGKKLYEILKS